MAIELPDLTTLNAEAVQAAQDTLTQYAMEAFASTVISFASGVISDIVIMPLASIYAAVDDAAQELRRSTSLIDVTADPEGADPDTVDRILANYNVTRKAGSQASGSVAIVVSGPLPLTIPVGFGFTAGANRFVTELAFAARVSEDQIVAETDRLLRPLGDGRYVFTIDVVASEDGVVGVRRLTRLEPDSVLPGVVLSYAESDFTDGADPETNAALIERLKTGLAPTNLADEVTIEALVQRSESTETVIAVSSVGYGDTAQRRHHGLLHTSGGGRLDVWAKTQPIPERVAVRKTATAVSVAPLGGTRWQVSIAREDAPGFYNVDLITPLDVDNPESNALAIASDLRGYDVSGDDYVPDITSVVEAAYSYYQTAIIQFDSEDDYVSGATKDFTIYLRAAAGLIDVHELLTSRTVLPVAGDVLVRAAVPCDVTVAVTILVPTGVTAPEAADVAQAVADVAAQSGFDSALTTGQLAAAAQSVLPDRVIVGHLSMVGVIRCPDGSTIRIEDPDGIRIPSLPEQLVTRKTTCFYLLAEDVSVTFSPL